MAKYLDPKADLTFKKVFGEHPNLVASLLNSLLPLPAGEEIADISGKLLFIYTDGLNEAEDQAQEKFGDDQLQQMLHQMKSHTAKQVIETFSHTVESHRKGAEPNDDLTMLAIRVIVQSK